MVLFNYLCIYLLRTNMLNPALEFSIGTQQVTKLLIEKKEQ